MIVLTKDQKDTFLDFKKRFQELLNQRHVDLVPIEIKGDLFILPEEVFSDENFKELKEHLLSEGHLREVNPDEFIDYTT